MVITQQNYLNIKKKRKRGKGRNKKEKVKASDKIILTNTMSLVKALSYIIPFWKQNASWKHFWEISSLDSKTSCTMNTQIECAFLSW